ILLFLLAAGAMVTDAAERSGGDGLPIRWIRFLIPPAVLSMGALDWTLFSGMENAFHLGVWGICMFLALQAGRSTSHSQAVKRAWVLGAGGAILVATRPESGVCVAAFGIYGAWRTGAWAGAGSRI